MCDSTSLQDELRRTRRELQAARRALQERRYARSQPISSEITVRALTAVLQRTRPPCKTARFEIGKRPSSTGGVAETAVLGLLLPSCLWHATERAPRG